MKMSYDQFERCMQDNILHYLPNEVQGAGTNIKDNCLNICFEDEGFELSLNLDKQYKKHVKGKSVAEICKEISDYCFRPLKFKSSLGILKDLQYEKVKDSIVLNLVNFKNNQRSLEKGPHIKMEDLAVCFEINLSSDDGQNFPVTITKQMQEKIGVSTEKLYEIALNNTERMYPAEMIRIEDIKEDIPKDIRKLLQFLDIHCLTNSSISRGVTTLLYPETMKTIEEKIGRDVYVVPIARRFVMFVPKDGLLNAKVLGTIVRKINQKIPKKEDILADHVYEYHFDKKELKTVKESLLKYRGMER